MYDFRLQIAKKNQNCFCVYEFTQKNPFFSQLRHIKFKYFHFLLHKIVLQNEQLISATKSFHARQYEKNQSGTRKDNIIFQTEKKYIS